MSMAFTRLAYCAQESESSALTARCWLRAPCAEWLASLAPLQQILLSRPRSAGTEPNQLKFLVHTSSYVTQHTPTRQKPAEGSPRHDGVCEDTDPHTSPK